jgi:hypothetical protein
MKTPYQYGLKFHHLGLAVKQPDSAVRFLSGLGYQIGPAVRDELQNVHLALCIRRGMPAVEIVYPTETPGPLAPILKSNASMIYHICYESRNREKSLSALDADKNLIVLLSAPRPAVLFGGRKVSFYAVAGFGVIEILEPG